ncbi:unannotated protein [freshwater metagenome]|uniref:Unannotated protein n=1 Tax=freshwater metagenome TaxID=449393 RepID=A0A6J6NEU1_9ZZZZ
MDFKMFVMLPPSPVPRPMIPEIPRFFHCWIYGLLVLTTESVTGWVVVTPPMVTGAVKIAPGIFEPRISVVVRFPVGLRPAGLPNSTNPTMPVSTMTEIGAARPTRTTKMPFWPLLSGVSIVRIGTETVTGSLADLLSLSLSSALAVGTAMRLKLMAIAIPLMMRRTLRPFVAEISRWTSSIRRTPCDINSSTRQLQESRLGCTALQLKRHQLALGDGEISLGGSLAAS